VPRVSGVSGVEIEGIFETLAATKELERGLRIETNGKIRTAAKTCASVLAVQLARAASGSGVPVASRVARSIRVKSDRIPVVSIGGAYRVGRSGGSAGALVWGSEQGPKGAINHFAVPPSSGYWIAPTVEAFARDEALTIYKRAIVDLLQETGLL